MWIRDIEVLTGSKRITNLGDDGLEINFSIPFSDRKEPDVSEVTIYNLSNDTINQIKNEKYLILNAGYKDLNNKGNILTGELEDVTVDYSGQDKLVKLTVSDGAKSWRNAILTKSYAENTKSSFIMRELVNLMGYEIGDLNPVKDIVFTRGYSIEGSASNSLSKLVKETDSKMFINKNRIYIRDVEKGDKTGFILKSDTGLIGIPVKRIEEGNKGSKVVKWEVESTLNPQISTDSLIKIDSKVVKGQFRVESGRHTTDFTTKLVLMEG